MTHPTNHDLLNDVATAFSTFCKTIAAIRHPESGCPWDLKQTHESLRRYMLEEAYEAVDVMTAENDSQALCEELGDVLLQVVLNAQVAKDSGNFDIVSVIKTIDAKMKRRHPHVFGDTQEKTAGHIPEQWDAIKKMEKASQGKPNLSLSERFNRALRQHPSSYQALEIGKQAATIKFDWDDAQQVFTHLQSEIQELALELEQNPMPKTKIADELGDIFFTLTQLCRHLKLDPEVVAFDGNRKFVRRFSHLETLAQQEGIDPATASKNVLETLWQKAKKQESTP